MLTAAAAGVALLILRVVSVVVEGRIQNIPGGPPFWMAFGVSYRTLLFVAGLAVLGAAVSGLVPALQQAGWAAYDQYLKANRVESGVRSYGEVLTLVLRTQFDDRWRPRLRAR